MMTNSCPTLHTLNKTAQNTDLNLKLSQMISKGDSVILIEDGVYQCLTLFSNNASDKSISWASISRKIYALKDDALARGIPITTKGIVFVNYEEFVQLSLLHKKVVSWY